MIFIRSLTSNILDMLSPTRSAAQAVLKNIVATTAAALQETASASMEQKEDSNDGDDDEPVKKKFKDDTATEVIRLSFLKQRSDHFASF